MLLKLHCIELFNLFISFKSSMVQQRSLVEDKKIGMTIFGQFFIRYLI